MDKSLVVLLNKTIKEEGSGFGPALNNLILYGPYDKRILSNENLNLLKDRQKVISDAYKTSILPKLGDIIGTITPNNIKITSDKKKLSHILKVRPFEWVRSQIAKEYKGQFKLDTFTLEGIFSKEDLSKNDYIKFALVNGYILSYRQKDPEKLKEKYSILYDKYINSDDYLISNDLSSKNFMYTPKIFEDFLVATLKGSYKYWDEFSYYNRVYSDLNNFMVGDDFGVKIIDLNQKRAEETMETLVTLNGDLSFSSFNNVKERFDDHTKRVSSSRPGGVHYTLTDKGLRNFPVEVQFSGIKSFIYDKFGPNAHDIYSFRGKKGNSKY